ncbi:MAG: hypothetical protein AAB217_09050, partial [Chloroflexota bacterium]
YQTLNVIRLKPSALAGLQRYKESDRRHPLLAAALICERLDDWPHVPATWAQPSPVTTAEKPAATSTTPPSAASPSNEPVPPPAGQLRIIGSVAGFAIGLVAYLALFAAIKEPWVALLVLAVIAVIAFTIAGIITGKDALLVLGEIIKTRWGKWKR